MKISDADREEENRGAELRRSASLFELPDALGGSLMLRDHGTKLLQHVVQLRIQPFEFPIVPQDNRGEDGHVLAQTSDIAGKPLQRPPDVGQIHDGLASIVAHHGPPAVAHA